MDIDKLHEDALNRSTISIPGTWCIYFNRHGAEPLMWCISPEAGDWEIAVRDVEITGFVMTVYRKKPTADEDDGKPSAWITASGMPTIGLDGEARIVGA